MSRTNWRKEFQAFSSNTKTALALVQLEANVPGSLDSNQREFVLQVLGNDALSELDALTESEMVAAMREP